jgi:small subunit ribosomal protein S1
VKKTESETILPLTELKLGSKVEGRVAAFTEFGVFIKINYNLKNKGGAGYALLHKSQIRDEAVEDPKKLFRIGNVVKDLRILTINYEKGEVGVSLRKQRDTRKSMSEFEIGKEYKGKVARVVSYGAFVDVGAKANALLHISRISQKKIENIRNWVNEGDTVNVRIVSVDDKKNTLAASMLDMEADEYLNKRSKQLKKMRQRSDEKNAKLDGGQLKSELEYFEDAVQDLENALR